MQPNIKFIYKHLFDAYGPQGWWPLQELDNSKKIDITKSGSLHGYHPKDYSYPKTDDQRFEICLGAILTQNTSWTAVDKALSNLKKEDALTSKGIKELSDSKLKEMIRPAGYYNQKAKYIRGFVRFFENLHKIPTRDELLSVKGIGNETADSILLYAFKQPEFVVDAYSRRILENLEIVDKKSSYVKIKKIFEDALPRDIVIYQEYHALLVEHAKRHYDKKEHYKDCPLRLMMLQE